MESEQKKKNEHERRLYRCAGKHTSFYDTPPGTSRQA